MQNTQLHYQIRGPKYGPKARSSVLRAKRPCLEKRSQLLDFCFKFRVKYFQNQEKTY